MKRIFFSRTMFFILFALAAVMLMGAALTKPAASDLDRTAGIFARESAGDFTRTSPAVLLRANVVK